MPGEVDLSELRNPLEGLLGYQLRLAAQATLGVLGEAFEEQHVTLTEGVVIRLVEANPGCNQAEIGRALHVRCTNMVPVVAGLVDAGLLRREAADGRTNALFLTPAGRAVHDKIAARAVEHEQQFFGDIDGATKQGLLELLQNVRAKASAALRK